MSKIIEPLRGVHDVLPAQVAAWQHLERITREVFAGYGYEEFRVPIIEQTQLFKRSIGDFTDIVEKEMFSFVDQGEDHITLRPEATAGIVRAMISNGLLREGRLRVWCMGPMFRRERPQAGRYRQFHQIDAEAFGFEGPDIDAEMILLSARLLRRLGLDARQAAGQFARHAGGARGLPRAADRVFRRARGGARRGQPAAPARQSAAHPRQQEPRHAAPHRGCAARCSRRWTPSRRRTSRRCARICASAGIEYHVEPRLVRGLDYYTRTVFEWTTDALGSQSTVCAGGRYDGLVAQLGGAATPGIGWAMGQERIVMLLEKQGLACRPDAPAGLSGVGRGAHRDARVSSWRSNCATRGRLCGCRSIWAAAVSRRSSSAPTRAARVRARFGGGGGGPRGRRREGAAPGIGAGGVPHRSNQ